MPSLTGQPTQINTTTSRIETPTIQFRQADGTIGTLYKSRLSGNQDGAELRYLRYMDSSGTPIDTEYTLELPSILQGTNRNVSDIAVLENGNLAVSFNLVSSPSVYRSYIQIYSNSGARIGAEIAPSAGSSFSELNVTANGFSVLTEARNTGRAICSSLQFYDVSGAALSSTNLVFPPSLTPFEVEFLPNGKVIYSTFGSNGPVAVAFSGGSAPVIIPVGTVGLSPGLFAYPDVISGQADGSVLIAINHNVQTPFVQNGPPSTSSSKVQIWRVTEGIFNPVLLAEIAGPQNVPSIRTSSSGIYVSDMWALSDGSIAFAYSIYSNSLPSGFQSYLAHVSNTGESYGTVELGFSGSSESDALIQELADGSLLVTLSAGTTGGDDNQFEVYSQRVTLSNTVVSSTISGTAGPDSLTGTALPNVIAGLDSHDIIDGGPGSDTIDGGAGNDMIVYDAADTAANVTGGLGTDTLLFSGAAPTSFNLTAQGFERAQSEQNDTGSNAWSLIRTVYTATWLTDTSDEYYDNGTRIYRDLDNASAGSWSEVRDLYNAAGLVDFRDEYYDNGTRTLRDLDQASAFSWTETRSLYTAGGLVDFQDEYYDNGTRTLRDFDQANNQSHTESRQLFTSAGLVDFQDEYYDNGTRTLRDLNQAGTGGWNETRSLYTAGGLVDFQDEYYTNGTRILRDFDQASANAWTEIRQGFTAASLLDYQDVYYDNSTRIYIDYDQANAFAWNTRTITYNAAGGVVSDVFV